MCIYVVSLIEAQTRKKRLKDSFPKNFSEFIFVDAIDGRKLNALEYFELIKLNLYENNRLLSPSEIGCSLSHIQVLKAIVGSNKPGIVLEDDIIGADEKLNIAKTALAFIGSNDVIFLGGFEDIRENGKIFLHRNHKHDKQFSAPLYDFDHDSLLYLGRTCCYMIGVDAAKVILESQEKAIKLADSWHKNTLNSNVKFKFTPLLSHPRQQEEGVYDTNIEAQRVSIRYKKTYQLMLESIKANCCRHLLSLKSIFKKKFFSKRMESMGELLEK